MTCVHHCLQQTIIGGTFILCNNSGRQHAARRPTRYLEEIASRETHDLVTP